MRIIKDDLLTENIFNVIDWTKIPLKRQFGSKTDREGQEGMAVLSF